MQRYLYRMNLKYVHNHIKKCQGLHDSAERLKIKCFQCVGLRKNYERLRHGIFNTCRI